MKPLTRHALASDLQKALQEFAPLAQTIPVNDCLEGSIPVITPSLADVKCVACVYADPHQDLPYPRYSVLAPIVTRPDLRVFVKTPEGNIQQVPLLENEIVVLDSHLVHWVEKPKDFPQNWEELSSVEKSEYKKKNMVVFANIDFEHYPTKELCEEKFRKIMCLPTLPKKKNKFR